MIDIVKNSIDNRNRGSLKKSRYFASRLILILFGVLIFGGAEGVLRLAGLPPDDPGIIKTYIDPFQTDGEWVVTRDKFLHSMRKNRFRASKPKGLTRIFSIGGSTTLGYPFPEEAAWPERLERRLSRLYGEDVEVINLGASAYGSSRTLGVFRGVLKYNPDIIVVCVGDAEYVEDSYRTSIQGQGKSVPVIRNLHLARLLGKLLPAAGEMEKLASVDDLPTGGGAGGFLFSPIIHGTVYSPDEEQKQEVMERFASNLREIIVTAQQRGIGIVICTVPSNIVSWPPDPSSPAPALEDRQWNTLDERARKLESADRWKLASAVYGRMIELKEGDAEINYRYGKALLESGKPEEARPYLIRARDVDPAPVRATTMVNEKIRNLASEYGVPIADLEHAFAKASPYNLTGSELILDYAHPTEKGHAVAERVVWEALTTTVAEWEEYSGEIEKAITAEPIKHYEPELDADLAFVWGQIFTRKKMWKRAEQMFRRSLDLVSDNRYAALNLAQILVNDGRYQEAVGYLSRIVSESPGFSEPYLPLARAYYLTGDIGNAEKYFKLSIKAGEQDSMAIRGLMMSLLDIGKYTEALDLSEEGIKKYPPDCYMLAARGRAMELMGDVRQAEEYYKQTTRENPSCSRLWENLGLLYLESGSLETAAQIFEKGIDNSGQSHPLHYLNLGHIYLTQGKKNKAIEKFITFVRLVPAGIEDVPPALRDQVRDGVKGR